MNCELYQRDLLNAPDPGAAPADVAAHLEDCPACRQLQRRLVVLERQVRLLPVPTSDARQQFLQRILNEPLPGRDTLPLHRPVWRRLALGTICAAAVAAIIVVGVMVGGWLSPSPDGTQQPMAKGADKTSSVQVAEGTGPGPKVLPSHRKMANEPPKRKTFVKAAPPSGTLADRLMEYDLRLAAADSRDRRLELLTEVAATLKKETRILSQTAAREALDVLDKMYAKIIGTGVMTSAAEELPGSPSPADALRQFQSDQQLIGVLVDASLRLAEEEDTFKRAALCNGLAAHLAQEIQQAAANKEGERASLLGRSIQVVLIRGVASNVRLARSSLPAGSPREKEAQRIGQEMARFLQPLPEALQAGVGSRAESVLLSIATGRQVVERAIQTTTPAPQPRNKPSGKRRPGAPRP